MELHRGHLHRPHHVGRVLHAQLVGGAVPAREVHVDGLDPVRGAPGQPLLVHLLAGDAGREAVQHARPVAQGAHDALGRRRCSTARGRAWSPRGPGSTPGRGCSAGRCGPRPPARRAPPPRTRPRRAQRRQELRFLRICIGHPEQDHDDDPAEPQVLRVALVGADEERRAEDDRQMTPPAMVPSGKLPCHPHSADGSSWGSTSEPLRHLARVPRHARIVAQRRTTRAGMMVVMTGTRSVLVLGSTGSVGTQALELIAEHPDRFTVAGLAAGGR